VIDRDEPEFRLSKNALQLFMFKPWQASYNVHLGLVEININGE